jgi:hydroxyethylthiazole kinase-like uncharacterized protein yjeF
VVNKPLSKSGLRALDKKASQSLGIPENILIENASLGIMDVLRSQRLLFGPIAIFSGRGNNGADSLALARHLLSEKISLKIYLVLEGKAPNREVEFQLNILRKITPAKDIKILNNEDDLKSISQNIKRSKLVIDGVFGIGYKPPLSAFHQKLFFLINDNAVKTLAVDIPSGMLCDDGVSNSPMVKADITVTFVAPKSGFTRAGSRKYTGKIFVKDIGASRSILEQA